VFELSAGKSASLGFYFSRSSEKAVETIFKYDSKSNKYLPATHIFPEFVLQGFEKKDFAEQVGQFKESKSKFAPEFLQIFIKYVYAGKEAEAWKFFDETELEFNERWDLLDKLSDKEQLRKRIKIFLDKDPIYKFIQKDSKRVK